MKPNWYTIGLALAIILFWGTLTLLALHYGETL